MKKLLALILLVPLLVAAKPLRVVVTEAGPGVVAVDLSDYPGKLNPYSVWVAVYCYDDAGVPASAEFLPVQYGDNTDPDPTVGEAGPFTLSTDDCAAWAWEFPSTRPISNTLTL